MSQNPHKKLRLEEALRKAWLKRYHAPHDAKPHGVTFYDVTLTFGGSMFSLREHATSRVGREAVALFAQILDAAKSIDFIEPLPVMDLALNWTCVKGTAALATFLWHDMPVTTSALLSGIDSTEDQKVAVAFQSHLILRACQNTPFEPGFYLPNASERPLLATFVMPNPLVPPKVFTVVADAETCLAAVFFEKVLRKDR